MDSIFEKIINIKLQTGQPLDKKTLYNESFELKEQGHNQDLRKIIISKDLFKLIYPLMKIKKPKFTCTDRDIQFRITQIGNAKAFFNKHFKLHRINNFDKKKCHPFNIDIVYDNINPFYAWLNITCTTSPIDKTPPEYLFNVILSKYTTELTGLIYAHELTHSQLYTRVGSIKELYNSELLPIFMELLYIYDHKDESSTLIPLHNHTRLKLLMECINSALLYQTFHIKTKHDIVETYKYIVSTITAYQLFNIYLNGDEKLRKYIIYRIQNIFDGKITLEELLEEFNLSWSNDSYKIKEKS